MPEAAQNDSYNRSRPRTQQMARAVGQTNKPQQVTVRDVLTTKALDFGAIKNSPKRNMVTWLVNEQ